MIRILLMDLDFRIAATATGSSRAQSIVRYWSTSSLVEFRWPIIVTGTHTVISSFLFCATFNILKVLSKRFFSNMIPNWCFVFQVLRKKYWYIWHPFPLIKRLSNPPFSQPFSPFSPDVSIEHLYFLCNLGDFFLHYPTYLALNLFDHKIILMHHSDSINLFPPTLNYDYPVFFGHHYVLQRCILLAIDCLKHLLLRALSITPTWWTRDRIVRVGGRDPEGEGQWANQGTLETVDGSWPGVVGQVGEDGVAQVEGEEVQGLEVVEETQWGVGVRNKHKQGVIRAQHLGDLAGQCLYSCTYWLQTLMLDGGQGLIVLLLCHQIQLEKRST